VFFPGMVFGFFVGRYDLKMKEIGFSHVEVAHHIK
jgi:hypothetical protein